MSYRTQMRVDHPVLSGHALRRAGRSLRSYEIGDLLHWNRAVEVRQDDPSLMDRKKYNFWNSVLDTHMIAVVSKDLCVVTAYPDEHKLSHRENTGTMVSLAKNPFYLPVFNTPLCGKVNITVVAQSNWSKKGESPTTFVAGRIFKAGKTCRVWQALQNNTWGGIVNSICRSELKGLLPLGLYVDGIKIPISAVLNRRCHNEGRIVVPWAFRVAHN
ncbi:MAG: hypothetical protein WCQ00_01115 [bacterium]